MAEETHVRVSSEHSVDGGSAVEVSHEPEAEHVAAQEAAAAAVATAEAAAALAHETAAHAELQAAEEVAEVQEELSEWQQEATAALSDHSTTLARMNERLEQLGALEESRHAERNETLARLEALENHPSLIRQASQEATEPASGTTQSPAGAEAEANQGPAEVSSAASLSNPNPTAQERSPPARQRVKRRWI